MITAQQLLTQFLTQRSESEHAHAVMTFFNKLAFVDANDRLPVREFVGVLAAMVAEGRRLASKSYAEASAHSESAPRVIERVLDSQVNVLGG